MTAEPVNRKNLFLLLASALILRLVFSLWGEGSDLAFFMQIGDRWFTTGNTPYTFDASYQYTPLYLYWIWIARFMSGGEHLAYRVLAKAPQMLGDVLIGLMIIRLVLAKTSDKRAALTAGLLYLFNPLLIYNCAFYGRFDQISSFFAVAGFAAYESAAGSSLLFAASFCTKTYTLFFFPYFLFKDRRRMFITGAAFVAMLAALSAFFIVRYGHAGETFRIMFNLAKHWPLGLSWQTALYGFMDVSRIMEISRYVLLAYLFLLLVFPKKDFLSFAAFSLAMFPLFSMLSFEQYMTWSIPFLLLDHFFNNKRHALFMVAVFTLTGLFSNQDIQIMKMLGLPQNVLNISYAACMIAYGALEFIWLRKNGGSLSFLKAREDNK